MYQNVNTGEIWKLSHVETVRTWKNEVKVYLKIYVFENGERLMDEYSINMFKSIL